MAGPQHIIDVLKDGVRDISRPNFFEIELNRPSGRDTSSLTITQNLIRSVDVPSLAMGDIIIRRIGRKITLPGAIDFAQDLLINIHHDVNGLTRSYIANWQKDYIGKIGVGTHEDVHDFVLGNVHVYQLDGQHKRVAKYTFRNAYPKTLGSLDLSHENEDQTLNYLTGFAFSMYQYSNDFATGFSDISTFT